MRSSIFWFRALVVSILASVMLMAASPVMAQTQISPYKERDVKPGFSPPGPTRLATPQTENIFLYYPKHNMYQDVENDRYIYYKSGRWLIYNQVPMDDSLGPSYTIESETGKPYLQNEEHKEQYPYAE